ncbi:MAG: hypothetical protein ACR2MB_17575 [Acidimicrobiales bacterium]
MSNGYGAGVVVRVELVHDEVALAADVLWQVGPTAIEEQPGPRGGTVLVAGFASPAEGARAVRALADAGQRGQGSWWSMTTDTTGGEPGPR